MILLQVEAWKEARKDLWQRSGNLNSVEWRMILSTVESW